MVKRKLGVAGGVWAGVLGLVVLGGVVSGQATRPAGGMVGSAVAGVSSGIPAALLGQVPAEAVAVYYWAGTEGMGKTWSDSKAAKAAAVFKVNQVMEQLVKYQMHASEVEDRTSLPLRAIFGPDDVALRKPSLVAIVPSANGEGFVTVHMVDGGKDVEAIARASKEWGAKLPARGVTWREGNVLMYSPSTGGKPKAPKKGEVVAKFAETDWYKDALGRMVDKPAMVVILKPRSALVPSGVNEAAEELLNGAGLGEGDYVVVSGAVEGTDWLTRGFFRSAVPRKGLAGGFVPGRKVSEALMKRVPAEATYFSTYRLDPNKILGGFKELFGDDMEGGGEFAKRGQQITTKNQVELAINRLSWLMGVDVRNGLIRGLGADWVLATVKTKGGEKSGVVAMNRLADVEKVRAALVGVSRGVDRLTLAMQKRGVTRYRYDTDQRPGMTLHRLRADVAGATTQESGAAAGGGAGATTQAVGGVRPVVWTIRDGLLVVGDDVDVVAAALPIPAKSVVDSGRVKEILGILGAPDTAAVGYADLTASGLEGLEALRELMGYLEGGDAELKLKVLVPTGDKVLPLLGGAMVSAAWTEEAGYFWRSRGPFPGAELFTPLGVSVLRSMPEVLRSGRAASQVEESELEAPESGGGAGGGASGSDKVPN